MARVIKAKRNFLGRQYALNAIQITDLQLINKILSISGQILGESKHNAISAVIHLPSKF